jgi:hypothetical protein
MCTFFSTILVVVDYVLKPNIQGCTIIISHFRSTLCQEKKLVSENVITPRVDVYSLNQIGREIEKIQVFESGMEAKRKVLKERHRTEMNTIMEKQKKENNEWDVNILKKKELVNEIQGILTPLVPPLKHSIGYPKRYNVYD